MMKKLNVETSESTVKTFAEMVKDIHGFGEWVDEKRITDTELLPDTKIDYNIMKTKAGITHVYDGDRFTLAITYADKRKGTEL